ncbi:hypothetical protein ANMWB30_24900 [Arthrobacter sp. MWB30]|nr:hypothetical protein ANMWB30_24900 [Arthrobacter sp. MWB30]
MSILPQDVVSTNGTNTALRIRSVAKEARHSTGIRNGTRYVLVLGDAGQTARMLLAAQKAAMIRQYNCRLALLLAPISGALLLIMTLNHEFVISGFFGKLSWLGIAMACVVPAFSTVGSIAIDSPLITAVIYQHLTSRDRDALFTANAAGPQIYQAALTLLEEKYSAEAAVRRIEHRQRTATLNQSYTAAAEHILNKGRCTPLGSYVPGQLRIVRDVRQPISEHAAYHVEETAVPHIRITKEALSEKAALALMRKLGSPYPGLRYPDDPWTTA